MKHILIAGTQSYIGGSFKEYLSRFPDRYSVSEIDARGLKPEPEQFEGIDAVFCVAGIAHIKETSENRHLYYEVNRDLVVEIAKAAKTAGVRQFVLLSSMSVYGLTTGHIRKDTRPEPNTAYGQSKLQADEQIRELEGPEFVFTCLRPPMVYGKNCRGNYQSLRKFALKSPVFPAYQNRRSMIYIGNLCEFIKQCIDYERGGLFFPQNAEYTDSSRMVRMIAEQHGKKIKMVKVFNWAIRMAPLNVVRKVFGNLTYEPVDTVDKYDFYETIRLTEQ